MTAVKRRAEAIWIEARTRWQINVQRDGIRKTFTSSTPGRKGKHEAEAKADKWLKRFASEQQLGSALDLFLEDKKPTVKESTISQYNSVIKRILRSIPASRKLSVITPYDWQKIINLWVATEGASQNAISFFMTFVLSFNEYCWMRRWECDEIRRGMLTIPAAATAPKKKKALTTEQLRKLFSLTEEEYPSAELFQLAVLTGLRRGELLALKWEDVTDNAVIVRTGKTQNAARTVPLSTPARQLLEARRARVPASDKLVFTSERTGRVCSTNTLQYHWTKVSAAIDASDSTIHELRHTFISMVKSDLPLAQLKQVVGHSASMDTYGVYAHPVEADVAEEQNALDKVFDEVL